MRGLVAVAAVAVAAMSGFACGDEEDVDGTAGTADDATEIAATINEVREAVTDRDAGAVCGLLTEEGRGFMVRVAERSTPPVRTESCEEATEAVFDGRARMLIVGAETAPDYTAADVDLRPHEEGGLQTDPVAGEPESVEVRCKEEDGSSFFLERTAEGWKLQFPICSGR